METLLLAGRAVLTPEGETKERKKERKKEGKKFNKLPLSVAFLLLLQENPILVCSLTDSGESLTTESVGIHSDALHILFYF